MLYCILLNMYYIFQQNKKKCLDKWRTTREDRAFSRCTECLKSYTLISITEDTFNEKCCRKTTFLCYVTRDIGFGFILFQAVVFIMMSFVWQCDGASGEGYLITLLHATGFPEVNVNPYFNFIKFIKFHIYLCFV